MERKLAKPKKLQDANYPSDYDLERAVVYCMLMDNSLIKQSHLKDRDFYHHQNQTVFRKLMQMSEDGLGVDYITMVHALKEDNDLEKIGGPIYFGTLGDLEASTHMFRDYEFRLKELCAKRLALDMAAALCHLVNNSGNFVKGLADVRSTLTEIDMELAGKSGTISDRVEDWLKVTDGQFRVTEMYRDLAIVTDGNKKAALMALQRLEKKGVVQKCGDKRGCWRPVSIDMEKMDFINIKSDEYELIWPAATPVHELVKIYPGNLVIVAGEPNSGKTAMLLNLIRYNMEAHHIKAIRYLCSEGGEEELAVRLRLFEKDGVPMEFWENRKFSAWERSQDFAEVIDPDGFNLIDYLELYEEHYLIGRHLVHVQRKLNKGIAVIALQKDPKKDVAKGGFVVLEKPRLVVNMMKNGTMRIVKGKNWRNHLVNPDNKTYSYVLRDGCRFIPKRRDESAE